MTMLFTATDDLEATAGWKEERDASRFQPQLDGRVRASNGPALLVDAEAVALDRRPARALMGGRGQDHRAGRGLVVSARRPVAEATDASTGEVVVHESPHEPL